MTWFPAHHTHHHPDPCHLVWTVVAACLAGLALGLVVLLVSPALVDVPLTQLVQRLHWAPVHDLTHFFNEPLKEQVIPVLWGASILFLLAKRQVALASLFALGMLVGPVNMALKSAFARPRPDGPILQLEFPDDYSFPSAHVMTTAVFFGLWIVAAPAVLPRCTVSPIRAIAIVSVLLMAFSRVWVAAHWPTDVVAGVVFGWAMVAALWMCRDVVSHALQQAQAALERTAVTFIDAMAQPGIGARAHVMGMSLAIVF